MLLSFPSRHKFPSVLIFRPLSATVTSTTVSSAITATSLTTAVTAASIAAALAARAPRTAALTSTEVRGLRQQPQLPRPPWRAGTPGDT